MAAAVPTQPGGLRMTGLSILGFALQARSELGSGPA